MPSCCGHIAWHARSSVDLALVQHSLGGTEMGQQRLQSRTTHLVIDHQIYVYSFTAILLSKSHMSVSRSFSELPLFWGSGTDFLHPQQGFLHAIVTPTRWSGDTGHIMLKQRIKTSWKAQHAADLGRLVVVLLILDLFL